MGIRVEIHDGHMNIIIYYYECVLLRGDQFILIMFNIYANIVNPAVMLEFKKN